MALLSRLKEWHIHKLETVQRLTGLSPYHLLWIAFIEGLVIGLVTGWWLF